ncbi:hypothetical protein TSUD_325040 [Trifolium subterraneum]|uniref:U5 small nuclear ribonucleoprotein TSSC4 n=1 Tax=Trifolium subterraneum TaxID=3900 RepID=A0A2Z6NTZ8_TRISU|nr:hypothetical protein TSUD_325040 [Trifolium subterraneum]
MEDSFRVRVEKAFGSLPIPSSASLWSLSEDEINNNRPNPKPKPESEPKPYPTSSGVKIELENDLDEDENAAGPSKPSDYNDEQWEIRSSIGLDPTLDFEDEEDHYDKQALGKENTGDRLYMREINEDGIGISSRVFGDFSRDPRANHMAAKIKLKQDDEAAKKIDTVHVSEKSTLDIADSGADAVNPKSILKSKDNPSESRPNKRVRFDSECDDRDGIDDDDDDDGDEKEGTRDVRMKTSTMEEDAALNQPSKSREFASAVPDYIRNPSKYTHYTFDSETDMDDKANKEAYMNFLAQIKASKESSQTDEALDDLPSVTFIPKKKSGDVTMGENETASKLKLDVGKEGANKKAFPVSIATDDDTENSDVCAMEEDELEVIENTKKSAQKSNRKYRKKTEDDLEEPAV